MRCKFLGGPKDGEVLDVPRDMRYFGVPGSVPADDKYNTTECAICRRNEPYKWREARRKSK